MNRQETLFRISQLLARFTEQVKILNSNGEFSINVHAENILINILNTIYACNLKNVNYEENKIYPSIDLRDYDKRIAIQVTSTSNLDKIKHTLACFISNELYKDFDTLYIYIITEKQKKYKQSSIDEIIGDKIKFTTEYIIDKTDLYKTLNAQNDDQNIINVCKLLETQFADNKNEFDKWDLYCKGLYEYDQYIKNLYTYFDIKGFSPRVNNTLVRLNIDKIYVPLKFKFDFSNNVDDNIPKDKKTSYDIITALTNFDKIVILGDPGSGKSTTLKYLAYTICAHRASNEQLQTYIPLYLKATEFAKYLFDTGRSLSEFIIDINTKYGLLFSKSLENNKLIVLIDGLDEINITNQRHNVVEKINSFTAQYPEIKIIVSSRIVGYKETRLSGYFFHFEVDKFSDKQIYLFLNNWYSSISSYSDNNFENAAEEARKLFRSIKRNKSVYRLAQNPLLITIIALIYYQGSKLPEKRVALYEVATSTLLDNWVKLRANQKNNIDREILIELLALIAFHIHEHYSSGLIPERELTQMLTNEYSKIYPYMPQKELKQDVNDIISFLREDAGFLFEKGFAENGEALFGFVHLTFQEYFAAIEFNTKWKEGSLSGGLNDYIYNSNWTEVIKLTASLFKVKEPGRLGRSNATKFIADILKIKELLPEINRRLHLVCQILSEDVEIEFDVLKNIIDEIFNRLLFVKDKSIDFHTSFIDENCVTLLLGTNGYQDYLLKRIFDILQSDQSSILSQRLVCILMGASNISAVHTSLIRILESNQDEIKSHMFHYRTVLPVADIVKTELFRNEIVNYINSPTYSQKYEGHLPTQYSCCFKEDLEAWLLSISLITDPRIKKDLIDFYVFSWGIGDIDNIRAYYEAVKTSYPSFDLSRIENHIEKLDYYKSLGLEDYPILTFNGIDIYKKKDNELLYAINHKDNIDIVDYPFTREKLEAYFNSYTPTIISFCDIIISAINTESKEIIIHNNDELELLIQYYDTIHWATHVRLNRAIIYALSNLFINGIVNENILHWIKRNYNRIQFSFSTDTPFNAADFGELVKSSSLNIFDKLMLLKYTSPQFKDSKLLLSAIDEYNQIESTIEKEKYRDILFRIL